MDDLPAFTETVRRAAAMASFMLEAGCPLDEINAGGGLDRPSPGQPALDLDAYAAVLAEHLGPLGPVVSVEPGEFLFGDSAVLLAEVVTVEDRLGVPFVGLDAGWNVAPDRFVYEVPLEVVLCRDALPGSVRATTITGNINEGDDVFAEDYPFPEASRRRHRRHPVRGRLLAEHGCPPLRPPQAAGSVLRRTSRGPTMRDENPEVIQWSE